MCTFVSNSNNLGSSHSAGCPIHQIPTISNQCSQTSLPLYNEYPPFKTVDRSVYLASMPTPLSYHWLRCQTEMSDLRSNHVNQHGMTSVLLREDTEHHSISNWCHRIRFNLARSIRKIVYKFFLFWGLGFLRNINERGAPPQQNKSHHSSREILFRRKCFVGFENNTF